MKGALIITGGGGGIGSAIARGAAERGTPVVIVGRDQGRVDDAVRSLPSGAAATGAAANVRDPDAMKVVAEQALQRFGAIDALVCCAAGHGAEALIDDAPLDDFEQTFSTNVVGQIVSIRSVLPAMRAAGRGNIVLFSSGAGHPIPRPEVRSLAYQVSKFAVEGLVNGIAVQLRGSGINVNGFRPGRTAAGANIGRNIPNLRRPEQAVEPVLFLADLAPGEMSGYVLESSDFERGFRPLRRDYTLG